jgi:hypothetical protein
MTRRTLLSLPFVAPVAKALISRKQPKVITEGLLYFASIPSGKSTPLTRERGEALAKEMTIMLDPRCPKNSIEIIGSEAWE